MLFLRYNCSEVSNMKGQNTENNFIITFWKLYEHKEIEKISISQLCQLAGYNRTTFYAHFDNIYDLLNRAIDDLMLVPQTTLENLDDFSYFLWEDIFPKMFLTLLNTNSLHMKLLVKNHHLYLLEDKAKAIITPILKTQCGEGIVDPELDYIIEYQLSAAFGVIKYWFQAGSSLREKELIDLLYRITSKGVLTLLREKLPM